MAHDSAPDAVGGRPARQAKRQEDELRLKRNIEERRREKEEEARAREKIRVKLGAPAARQHRAARGAWGGTGGLASQPV